MSEKSIYIIGAGGHAKVIADMISSIEGYDLAGFIDKDQEAAFLDDTTIIPAHTAIVVAIGENALRKKIYDKFAARGFICPSIKSPFAIISKSAQIEQGSVIMPGAIVNAHARLGKACVINSAAVIEHDVEMGDFSSAAPSAVICGEAKVGCGSYIGANATILHGLHVGEWSVLGAGSVACQNIEDCGMYIGVPAKLVREKTQSETVL